MVIKIRLASINFHPRVSLAFSLSRLACLLLVHLSLHSYDFWEEWGEGDALKRLTNDNSYAFLRLVTADTRNTIFATG